MAGWYRRFPSDFIGGTLQLTLEEKGAYSIILDLIYAKGAPIDDDARHLAVACGCSLRKWKAIRARLLTLGKIELRDGCLTNERAEVELERASEIARKQAENGVKSGFKRRELARAVSKNKGLARTIVEPTTPTTTSNLSLTSESDPARDKTARAELASRIARSVGVGQLGDLPPSLCGTLLAEVEGMLAQGCDWTMDIAPALAKRPGGSWPGSPAYWSRCAVGNRDKRVLSNTGLGSSPAKPLHEMERRKRLEAKIKKGLWPGTWGPAEGEPGCCISPTEWEIARREMAA